MIECREGDFDELDDEFPVLCLLCQVRRLQNLLNGKEAAVSCAGERVNCVSSQSWSAECCDAEELQPGSDELDTCRTKRPGDLARFFPCDFSARPTPTSAYTANAGRVPLPGGRSHLGLAGWRNWVRPWCFRTTRRRPMRAYRGPSRAWRSAAQSACRLRRRREALCRGAWKWPMGLWAPAAIPVRNSILQSRIRLLRRGLVLLTSVVLSAATSLLT